MRQGVRVVRRRCALDCAHLDRSKLCARGDQARSARGACRMVTRWASALVAIGIAATAGAGAVPTIDIAAAAASWHAQFLLSGTKTEPTYIEHIRLTRDGDLFILEGGAPAGMVASRESVTLRANGTLSHLDCPGGMRCDGTEPPSGFLASAAILAA